MKLCVILSPRLFFLLLVSNPAHVFCVGGQEGREEMLHGWEMGGKKPVLASGQQRHSLRWHDDTAKFLSFITLTIKS